MATDRRQLISIQYLRAVAALMVVLYHATTTRDWLFDPLEGYVAFAWGVHIFFVISGFIMYVAARKENHIHFLGRRIIRILPLYWLATLALLAVNTGFHVWLINSAEFFHLIESLFFIPHSNPDIPGHVWPYLVPGWTLDYEMLFYLIFFLGLLVKRPLAVTTFVIFLFFFIGEFFNPETVMLKTYTKPVLLEFLCGMWIAHAYTKGLFKKNIPLIIIIGFSVLFLLPLLGVGKPPVAGIILASSMIVAGALSSGRMASRFKILHLLGDASYSIYLTHTFISLSLAALIWRPVPVDGWIQFGGWVILTLVLSSLVGIIVYLYCERPMIKWLRLRWEIISIHRRADKTNGQIT